MMAIRSRSFPAAAMMLVLAILISAITLRTADAKCPNWCSNRGQCYQENGEEYCWCDNGYTGNDCSIKICPKAFDILTIADNSNRRTISLSTSNSGGVMGGQVGFSFAGDMVKMPVDADRFVCEATVGSMLTVSKSNCKRTSYDDKSGAAIFVIELFEYPLYSHENNIYYHNGNPPLDFFFCNTTFMDSESAVNPVCEITDVFVANLPEYKECGNHGTCNSVTGACKCEKGFQGPACNDVSDNEDKHVVFHDGPFFSGNMLKVSVEKTASTSYNFLKLSSKDEDVTTIRGDGQLTHNGRATFREGVFVGKSSPKSFDVEGFNSSLFVSSVSSSDDSTPYTHHWLSLTDGVTVTSLSKQGDFWTAGSISAGNGTFTVEDGFITASNLEVKESMDVGGSLTIGESLSIGVGIVMSQSGITIDSTSSNSNNKQEGGEDSNASNPHPTLELRAQNIAFNGSIFEVHAFSSTSNSGSSDLSQIADASAKASLFRTITDGVTTFDVKANGDVATNSLRMTSGGIDVKSNGLKVNAGGIQVVGGIDIRSGSLKMPQAELSVGSLKLSASGSGADSKPLLSLDSASSQYFSNIIDISVNSVTKDFSILKVHADSDDGSPPLVDIRGDGSLATSGDVVTRGSLSVARESRLVGGLSLQQIRIVASDKIVLPLSSSYLVISDNKAPSKNVVSFAKEGDRIREGKLVIISNEDSEDLSGDLSMPAHTTAIFIFDGVRFVDVEALNVPIRELVDLKSITAANDLDIGNVTFSSGRLASTALTPGRVPFVGNRGTLIDSEKLTFNPTTGILQVPSVKISKLSGSIDATGSELKNGFFTNAEITGSVISADLFRLTNSSGGLAYFDSEGYLKSSINLRVNKNGDLELKSLHSDIDGNGHSLTDLSLVANEALIKEASIESLKLPKLASSTRTSVSSLDEGKLINLLAVDSNGAVTASRAISVDPASGTLHIPRLGGFNVVGDVNVNGHAIINANIKAGSVSADELQAKHISIVSLKQKEGIVAEDTAESESGAIISGSSLLTSDASGNIVLANTASQQIKLHNLEVASDLRVQGDIIGNGKSLLKGFYIDISSLDFGSSSLSKLQVDSLTLPTMKMSNRRMEDPNIVISELDARIVLADGEGQLHPSDAVLIRPIIKGNKRTGESEVVINSIYVTDSLTTNKLVFDKDSDIATALKGSGRKHELVGVNAKTNAIEVVSDAHLETLRIENGGNLFLNDAKLKFSGIKATLLAVDSDGVVVDARSLSSGGGNDLTLSHLTSQSLEAEAISTRGLKSSSLSFSDPKALFLSSGQSAGDSALLTVDLGSGDVKASVDISVNSIQASSSIKTQSLTASNLRLRFPDDSTSAKDDSTSSSSSSKLSAVLIASGAEGTISSRTSIVLEDLTTGKIDVKGGASVESITISSLASVSRHPVVANAKGLLETASSLTLDHLAVSGDVKVSGGLSVDQIRIPNAKTGVLIVQEATGRVSVSNTLDIDKLTSQSIVNTGELSTDSLRVSALRTSTTASSSAAGDEVTLITTDKNGLMIPMTTTTFLSQLSLPLPAKVDFSEVTATRVLSLGSLRLADSFPGVGQRGLLEVDSSGKVRVASDQLSVNSLVVSSDAKVGGKLTVNSLQFSRDNLGVTEGLLMLDKDSRELYTVKDVQVKDGVITATGADFKSGFINTKSASIGVLSGPLDAQNHVLSNARIEASKISNSEIVLESAGASSKVGGGGGAGDLVFRSSEDGLLVATTAVAIDKDGVVRLKGLAPMSPDAHFDITNARMTRSVIDSAKMINITSIETDRLDFVGLDGSSPTEVNIKGSLMVDGFIQGSGPYIDNSDKRLKKDIEPITGVLDQIDHLQAVSYNHRVDEFPSKHLDPRPQVGWIADELNATFPELVSTDKDGFLAVSYSRSAALLGQAIKELSERYEARIADLEAKISSLEEAKKCH